MTPEQKAAVRHVLERIAYETSQQDLEVIDDWLEDIEEAVRQAARKTCALCGRPREGHKAHAARTGHPFMETP